MEDKFPKDKSRYKLLISDFDGTLANKEKIIRPKVVNAIKKWIDSGREFVIATGRQYLMMTDVVEALGIVNPIIVRGGAEIVDPKDGRTMYSQTIDTNVVKEFIEFTTKNGFEIAIEKDDIIYSDYYRRSDYIPIITFCGLSEFRMGDVPKILLFAIDGSLSEKSTFIEKVLKNKFPQLFIVKRNTSIGQAWDITSEKANKHLSVLELIKILKIDIKDTVGVGDGYNDYPLLTAVGFKAAMENGNDELKEIADVIVPSYDNDGVAYLIENLLGKTS